MTREEELSYALLWLRNHYETGAHLTNPDLKPEVLDRVDRVLAAGSPITGEIANAFRAKYPRRFPQKGKRNV